MPDERTQTTPMAIEIPGMLSFLAHGNMDAKVDGLDTAAPPQVLRALLWTLAGGAVVLFPALFHLFAIFKGAAAQSKP